jgi:hypothetical protein
MTQKKSWKDWIFVPEEDPKGGAAAPAADPKVAPAATGDEAADDLIRRYSSDGPGPGKTTGMPLRPPGLDASPANSPSGEAPPNFMGGAGGTSVPSAAPGAPVDFEPVFKKAGIGDEERDKVNKALDLLDALPAETPQPVKKQIVETSLKTFGVKIDTIIETAVAELQTLHACIQAGAGETQKLLADSQDRIGKLEKQIADVRMVMVARQAEQQNLDKQASTRGLRVQQILEFFGQEKVGEVVKDSARLTGAKPAAAKK